MRLTTELAWVVGIIAVLVPAWVVGTETLKWYRASRCLLCRSRRRQTTGYCAPCFIIRGFLRDGGDW